MNINAPKNRVRERVAALPGQVRDCERCGDTDCMDIRRSSLNEQFYADDVGLKCMTCGYYATHGIPFTDPSRFMDELSERDGRVVDFARDGHNPREQLEALGYVGKAQTHE